MKKIIALLLTFIFSFTLLSCTDKETSDFNSETSSIEPSKEPNVESSLEPSEEPSDSNEITFENGFTVDVGCELPVFHSAYRIDKTEYDINDVTLTFYYGWSITPYQNIPSFELCLREIKGNKYIVKTVNENLCSEKYKCEIIPDYDNIGGIIDIEFNHSEVLTIPAGCFSKDSGLVHFSIYGDDVNEDLYGVESITGIGIFYKIVNGKVILSASMF